jgi:hypothetical protein
MSDLYHLWFNLAPERKDVELADAIDRYLGDLEQRELIRSHRLTRLKLGLGPRHLGEFHLVIEVDDLAQLDRAFQTVSTRSGVVEEFHAAVNQQVTDFQAALYRDFPDPQRVRGEEQF